MDVHHRRLISIIEHLCGPTRRASKKKIMLWIIFFETETEKIFLKKILSAQIGRRQDKKDICLRELFSFCTFFYFIFSSSGKITYDERTMCGIIGYVGTRPAQPILLQGLRRMEYRGYDSAGMAIFRPQGVFVQKHQGNVQKLASFLPKIPVLGRCGIAHTRWATHGIPSDANAHPHADCRENIFCVHNGVIENHTALRAQLIKQGHIFHSNTDSEVISHLIEEALLQKKSLEDAVAFALQQVQGTYAVVVCARDQENLLIAARQGSPLLFGVCADQSLVIASDISAIADETRDIIILEDQEMLIGKQQAWSIRTLAGVLKKRTTKRLLTDLTTAQKNGHPHFMIKEIAESPKLLREAISREKISQDIHTRVEVQKNLWLQTTQVIAVGCGGMSYNTLIAASGFESYAGIPSKAMTGSAFRYSSLVIDTHTTILFLSQSGETADTIAALRAAKMQGAYTIGITNVLGSTISREADETFLISMGPEISVASTKAMHGTIHVLAELIDAVASVRGKKYPEILEALERIPDQLAQVVAGREEIAAIAKKYLACSHALVMGRGYEEAAAKEGALKLMEIAYLPAQAFHTGELKHGPLALISDQAFTLFSVPQDEVYEKNISNIEEVRARKGKVIVLTSKEAAEAQAIADDVILIPQTIPLLQPILSMCALQLFAYAFAVQKGYPVDQPRHLAKSVTVE